MNPERGGLSPAHLYEYLTKARAKLFERVRPLSLEQYTQPFPFGLKTLRDTLVEMPQAEWYYVQRLRGEEVPKWEERPFARFYKTDFAPLERAWQEQAEETRATLGEISDWARHVEYTYLTDDNRPGGTVRTTTGGIASQLVIHEVHHRAQAMAMLRQLGAAAQDLDYSYLMNVWSERPV